MSSLLPRVIQIINKPPDERTETEIQALQPWFKKKSKLLQELKIDVLYDLIKNCNHAIKKKDEIVILQGEKGHCFYIILRGQVSIYHKESMDEGQSTLERESDRSKIGNFLVNLHDGNAFGEIALINPDCIRTASVIADERTDLIVIDRQLYNRSVANVIKREFDEKMNFVDSCHWFQDWSVKWKKHLAMSLKKEVITFSDTVYKQGEEADTMYFITNGECKVHVDPSEHQVQFHKMISNFDLTTASESSNSLKPMDIAKSQPSARRYSFKSHQAVNLCYLGPNQVLSDVEFALNMGRYYATCTSAKETSVMSLRKTHFERLFRRKNPNTIKQMAQAAELQLARRISQKSIKDSVPLLKVIIHGLYDQFCDGKYKAKVTFGNHLSSLERSLLPNSPVPRDKFPARKSSTSSNPT